MPHSINMPTPFGVLVGETLQSNDPLRRAITAAYCADEAEKIRWVLTQPGAERGADGATRQLARKLIEAVRRERSHASGVDALMQEFSLSSEEGIALMCLAEALLRIPDRDTADRLIADKIGKGDWRRHLGESDSLFINAATWGLLLSGEILSPSSRHGLGSSLSRLIAKGGEPLIRRGVDLAMRMLGNQFVMGTTIEQALSMGKKAEARGYRFSFDMLGEGALTAHDAESYFAAYEHAIHVIGRASDNRGYRSAHGVSVKLSALHPRYTRSQHARVMQELLPRLKHLVLLARQYDIGINIDAEEADRLELSLDLLEALMTDPELAGFGGIGFVVQAYQKRAAHVIDYLIDLARRNQRRLMVRLVKGAYWDTEIKRAQVSGLDGYPVFTRKVHTDLSYMVCAQRLLSATNVIYPQFATHNAQTLAAITLRARRMKVKDFEFQCLHGMGETLYDQVVSDETLGIVCRIYAPVGPHPSLLAYLVRRLLENGANTSFVNMIVDRKVPIEMLLGDPVEAAARHGGEPHPRIPLPADLYGAERQNSLGIDLSNEDSLRRLGSQLFALGAQSWHAAPLLAAGENPAQPCAESRPILNPADHRDVVGSVSAASAIDVERALATAAESAAAWQEVPIAERAAMLRVAAGLLEQDRAELISLAVREAGRTVPNAMSEVREACDFLRYYAARLVELTSCTPLGPIVCISPWNFPLAIFIGQISAALAAGNVVLAKPAEQTPLIAAFAVGLLHRAGIPAGALQMLPGAGETVGAGLINDPRVRGVMFTGSTEVAQLINRSLAKRRFAEHCEVPLIAETGGLNAMIVDSAALPEQVVQDVLTSAFDSAGQRCSALRILCLQSDIADRILEMLTGALQEMSLGRPDSLATDIGPVIDRAAWGDLSDYIAATKDAGETFYQRPFDMDCKDGTFIAPAIVEVGQFSDLQREVFGPVLHVLRYERDALPELVHAINASGYGLTLGIHSRIDSTVDYIAEHARVGNIYVNRNIVGAVVGVQPFGGEGKSGTGPKAGGPLYLARLQNNAECVLPDLAPLSYAQENEALEALESWSANHAYDHIAAFCSRYAVETPAGRQLTLPGPTGEVNTLRLSARGKILCAAAGTVALLNQLAAVLATGNRALILKNSATHLPAELPFAVMNSIDIIDSIGSLPDIQVALLDKTGSNSLVLSLAARKGAIISVVDTNPIEAIALWRLVVERTLSINTAAAGGNTSLMNLQD